MKATLGSLALAFLLVSNPAARAVAVYALTNDNHLLVVDGTVPQNVLSIQPLSNLDPGDHIVGIDVRPLNGLLYAVGDASTLYTVDPMTGVASKVGAISVPLSGTNFGVDFNPKADRLRVVSNLGQNLRIDPANGAATADTPLSFAPAPDPNAGATPSVADIAYDNNIAGAATTTLYGIDDTAFNIVVQEPNSGVLTTAGVFGVTYASHVGFDIAPSGIAYVAGKHDIPTATPPILEYILATVDPDPAHADPTTGEAPSESHGPIGDGTIPIRDIAVAPTISFSAPHYAIDEKGGSKTITVQREGFLNTTVSVQYRTFNDTASAASDYTTAAGTLTFGVGEATKTFTVPIIDDPFPEDDEFIGLYLTGLNGPGFLGASSIASLRISANDRPDIVGPLVEFIGLTGPSRGISGAVVHYNEDMNPATAGNKLNYKLTVYPRSGKPQVMTFDSADYDPVERRVTLKLAPFMQTNFTKMALRINGQAAAGTRPAGVTDLAGNLLDGNRNHQPGGDVVQIFKVFSGTTLKFTDRDGDRVTLELTGLGPKSQLDGVMPVGGPGTQTTQFWILDPIALQTTLKGTVKTSPKSNGIVVIAEIIGLDKKEFTPISTNPAFSINRLTFSTNATGLGL